MKSLLKIVCLILALGGSLTAGPLKAQQHYVGFVDLPLAQSGQSQPVVQALLQDQTGFLWLGTKEGLYRYDGYDFSVFRHGPEDPTSLSADTVTALYEDQDGTLWVGTSGGGLNRFDPVTERFRRYQHDPDDTRSPDHDAVQTIYEDRTGTLWIGTNAGLDQFDARSRRFTHYPLDALDLTNRREVSVRALSEDRDGRLWVGTSDGILCRFDEETVAFTCHRPGWSRTGDEDRAIVAIHEDRAGTLWLGTGAGLYRFDQETGAFIPHPLEDPDNPASGQDHAVTAIYETTSGALWIGTARHGLVQLDPETGAKRHFRHDPDEPNGLRDDRVLAIYEDRSGLLWVSTAAGVQKVFRTKFEYYVHDPSPLSGTPDDPSYPSSYFVTAIEEARSGSLWVGTYAGIFRLDREQGFVAHYYFDHSYDPNDFSQGTPNALRHNYVEAIEEDRDGYIWIATLGPLHRFDPKTETFTYFVHDHYDPHSFHGSAYVIHEDRDGALWFGARGLLKYEPAVGNFKRYRLDNYHLEGVFYIYEDSDETLWLGSYRGLGRFERSIRNRIDSTYVLLPDLSKDASVSKDHAGQIFGWARFYEPGTTPEGQVRPAHHVYGDQRGYIWGTALEVLFRFDPEQETFTNFILPLKDRNNGSNCLLVDNAGTVWIATDQEGLWRFNPDTQVFHKYTKKGGLPTDEFRPRACQKNDRGELFWGTARGLIVFHPDSLRTNPPSPVVLTDFTVQGKPVELDQAITSTEQVRLGYNQDSFTFTFAALDFANPAQNRYAYMLEGYDEDWVEAGNEHSAAYINVPYGEYVFRVKGANSDGVWSEEMATVEIEIVPPFWERGWFYPLVFIFGFSLIGLVAYAVRVRQLKTREQELNRLVEERTHALVVEKQKTEAQAEKLREQADKLVEMDRVKTRFYTNVSHEFRTPLTLILGPLRDALAGAYGPLNGPLQRQLEAMQRGSTRLHRLINQLLDISKLEAGRMQLRARQRDLVAFLRGIVQALTSLAERRRIALDLHNEPETLVVYFDAEKLEKVMYNLFSNALKFTPEGGRVRVVVQEVVDEEGAFAEIRVRDTGPGIPPGELPHVFDRFYQVDGSTTREHEGTGIGLSLAKELVALHQGTIAVESEVDFGTTFIVRLWLGTEHLDAEDLAVTRGGEEAIGDGLDSDTLRGVTERLISDEPEPVLPDDAPTILIVEDNADVRAYLKRRLAPYYHIAEAADGEAGLAKAHELKPALVVSDVMMPRMDGYDLCRALKADDALSAIPVILLTAKADEQSQIEGLETGADDYIAKPFSAEVLLARVENLIEIRRQLRERFGETFWVRPGDLEITSTDAAFLEQVRAVVEAHLGNHQFSVTWLADEVALSRRQLDRRLRSLTRLTASGFIRMMRLERAAQLLEQQAGNVSEVAYAVGYRDVHHFSKLFSQTFGISPSEYGGDKT